MTSDIWREIGEQPSWQMAIHEAGHALAVHLFGKTIDAVVFENGCGRVDYEKGDLSLDDEWTIRMTGVAAEYMITQMMNPGGLHGDAAIGTELLPVWDCIQLSWKLKAGAHGDTLPELGYRRACELLSPYPSVIEGVAADLQQRSRTPGERTHEIIAQALGVEPPVLTGPEPSQSSA